MNDYSENTVMREIRLGVVSCGDPVPLPAAFDGNIDVLWDCTTDNGVQVDHEVWHIVTKVYDPSVKAYFSQGNFKFEYTSTSTANGTTCTDKKFAAGSIENTGSLVVVNDPALQNILGYGYFAAGKISTDVAATSSCAGTSVQEQRTIGWLPPIKSFLGAGGSFDGEMTNPSCVGLSSSGTEKVKWSFSVPPAKN